MRHCSYTYLKPQNYYNHLLTFFLVISLSLTFSLLDFKIKNFETFFLKFFIILFLLFFISVLIEFFYKSEYMNPIEISKVEFFSNKFIKKILTLKNCSKYFNKYDFKSKKKIKKIFNNKSNFFISSIRKHREIYEVTIINEKKMFIFLILRFFGKTGAHKLFLKEFKNSFKIVSIN